MKVYILVGEFGAYEDHTTVVLGAFSSDEEARSAIPRIKELSAKQWSLYQERDRRRKEYLEKFEPQVVHGPGLAFPNGYKGYRNDQYAEAENAAGPPVAIIPDCDQYDVVCFNLDAIEGPQPS